MQGAATLAMAADSIREGRRAKALGLAGFRIAHALLLLSSLFSA
jgi:hypothetical protein